MAEKLEMKVVLNKDGTNWTTYKHTITIVLKTRKLFHVIEPKSDPKVIATDDEKLTVSYLLFNTIHEDQFRFTDFSEDPATAWAKLKQSKESQGGHVAVQLLHSLSTISQAQASVSEYAQLITDKTRILRSLCGNLSADQVIDMIATASFLKGLSPSLDAYAANAVSVNIKDLKLDVLVAGATAEEQRQANRESVRDDVVNANVAQSNERSLCKLCSNHVHYEDRCFKKYPNLRPNQSHKKSDTKHEKGASNPVFHKMKHQAKLAFANMAIEKSISSRCEPVSMPVPQHRLSTQANSANTSDAKDTRWLIDSGATRHMCNDRSVFNVLKKTHPVTITFGDGTQQTTDLVGTIEAMISTSKGSFRATITDVLYVPSIVTNLLSTRVFTQQTLTSFVLSTEGCTIRRTSDNKQEDIGFVKYENGLLPINIHRHIVASNAITPSQHELLWHARLGHLNKDALHQTSANVVGMPNCRSIAHHCDACHFGKERELPHPDRASHKSTEPLQLVHSDLSGPHPANELGYRYYIIFVDDYSGFCDVTLLRRKSEATEAFIAYKSRVETMMQRPVQRFRSDGGGEFVASEFTSYLRFEGIEREKSAPDAQQQNGRSERAIQSINNTSRSMLQHAALDDEFWTYAVQQAVHVRNRTSTRVLNGRTPYEAFHGRKPDVSNLRVFGCLAYGLIPKGNRKGKYSPRARKAIHLGKAAEYKAFTLLDIETGKIFTTRNVTFDEGRFIDASESQVAADSSCTTPDEPIDVTVTSIAEPHDRDVNLEQEDSLVTETSPNQVLTDQIEPESPPHEEAEQSINHIDQASHIESSSIGVPNPLATQQQQAIEIVDDLWKTRTSNGVDYFAHRLNADTAALIDAKAAAAKLPAHVLRKALSDRKKRVSANVVMLPSNEYHPMHHIDVFSAEAVAEIAAETATIPLSHKQAMQSVHSGEWKKAELDEMNALKKCGTYELVSLPRDRTVIGCKWVYSIKKDQDGKFLRFKARLVALGYSQQQGIDFDATYSPVLRYATLRALVVLSAKHNLHLHQMDVTTAFLNGSIDCDVYMKQPIGYEVEGQEHLVCKLKKGLYGLKQAGRLWYAKIDHELKSLGFSRLDNEQCVYLLSSAESTTIIGLYVDDLLLLSDDLSALSQVKEGLTKQFDMKDLGVASYILGIRITQDTSSGSISICQDEYVKQIVKRFGLSDAKHTTFIPMNPGLKLCKSGLIDEPESPKVDIKEYQQVIGSLLYAALGTRPDISFAVGKLAQYSSDPRKVHRDAADQIIRYLARTISYGLTYHQSNDELDITGYSDADWGGCLDTRRSTSAFIVMMSGSLVHWRSRKQDCVTCSTCEAEYVAASDLSREMISWRMMMSEIGFDMTNASTLYCDNQSAIALIKDKADHQRTKHISIRYHYIRELHSRGAIIPQYLNTEAMIADLLTKPLEAKRHALLIQMLGMKDVSHE
jgi:hypothetical protein